MTGPGVFRLNPAGRAERQAPLPAGEGPSGSGGLKQGGTAFLTPLSQAAPGRFYMDIMMDGLRPMPIVEDEEKVMKYDFTAIEQKWIGRMEKYLMEESVLNVGVFDEDTRFRSEGGFKKIDRIFQNKLESIVLELNEYLYDDGGRSA